MSRSGLNVDDLEVFSKVTEAIYEIWHQHNNLTANESSVTILTALMCIIKGYI